MKKFHMSEKSKSTLKKALVIGMTALAASMAPSDAQAQGLLGKFTKAVESVNKVFYKYNDAVGDANSAMYRTEGEINKAKYTTSEFTRMTGLDKVGAKAAQLLGKKAQNAQDVQMLNSGIGTDDFCPYGETEETIRAHEEIMAARRAAAQQGANQQEAKQGKQTTNVNEMSLDELIEYTKARQEAAGQVQQSTQEPVQQIRNTKTLRKTASLQKKGVKEIGLDDLIRSSNAQKASR